MDFCPRFSCIKDCCLRTVYSSTSCGKASNTLFSILIPISSLPYHHNVLCLSQFCKTILNHDGFRRKKEIKKTTLCDIRVVFNLHQLFRNVNTNFSLIVFRLYSVLFFIESLLVKIHPSVCFLENLINIGFLIDCGHFYAAAAGNLIFLAGGFIDIL